MHFFIWESAHDRLSLTAEQLAILLPGIGSACAETRVVDAAWTKVGVEARSSHGKRQSRSHTNIMNKIAALRGHQNSVIASCAKPLRGGLDMRNVGEQIERQQ